MLSNARRALPHRIFEGAFVTRVRVRDERLEMQPDESVVPLGCICVRHHGAEIGDRKDGRYARLIQEQDHVVCAGRNAILQKAR